MQPGGEVSLSLPVPEHMSYEDCKVVYIDSNGNVTDMNAVYKDGYMVFTTDHFSYYALVEQQDLLVGDVNSDGIVDNLDRMILSRYLADWAEYTEDIINMETADVNKDGVVDNLDRMVLSRHLADWEGYEVLPYTE